MRACGASVVAGFAAKVNDVVVEFGNARYQGVVDRYIAGEAVDREALRGAWEDTTQISGIWSLPMYEEMLADVRDLNRTLPSERMQPLACGAARPLWSDDLEEHQAANRRAEIVRNAATVACQPPASFESR